jgi:hypothetical protein
MIPKNFLTNVDCRQTGADALFVMNYPAYVGENCEQSEYHLSHPGLGYKYTSEQVVYCNFFSDFSVFVFSC